MFVILTSNIDKAGGDHGLRVGDKCYVSGERLYATREDAEAQVRRLNERAIKARKAYELAEESGLLYNSLFGERPNPFRDLELPRFEVFEVHPVGRVDVSTLPRLD